MSQVNATVAFYAYISAAWVLLNDVEPIYAFWGMSGNRPLDLLAQTGQLTLQLDNSTGLYSPHGPSALAGWKRGIPFKAVVTYDGKDYIRFRGFVSDIKIKPNNKDKLAYVTVLDWMDYAARFPIIDPGIQTNKRGDEMMATLLALMGIQPTATAIATGIETFPTIFDTVTSTTKAYDEFSKLSLSELGFIYLKKDRVNGETLTFESANDRYGWRAADTIPVLSTDAGFLLKAGGGGFILKAGGGGKLIRNKLESVTFDGSMITDFEILYGDYLVNRMTVSANPRIVDSVPVVLFSLAAPQPIASGQTITIKGTYSDPLGGLPISAENMITPVVNTDYKAWTNSAGSGTDFSANIVVTPNYGTQGFTHSVYNGSTNNGYITTFKCRGYGIYIYNPITHMKTDSPSIASYGYMNENLNQQLKNDLGAGSIFGDAVAEDYKEPQTLLYSVTINANKSSQAMMAFLNTDVGNLRYISIPEAGIAGNYYVQNVSFEMQNGVIMCKWIVKAVLSLIAGLSPLAIEFSGKANGTDGITFGYLPRVSNLRQRSMSVWVYADTDVPDTTYYGIMTLGTNYELIMKQNRKVKLYDQQFGPGTGYGGGDWTSTNSNVISLGAWTHIVVTHDTTSWPTNSVPIIYINGSAIALTEGTAPGGIFGTEIGLPFAIGNTDAYNNNFLNAFDGKIYDPRVYNRILTAAEVTALYNAGTPDATLVTDGLVFQGFAVKTGDLASYINQTLTSALSVRDNQYGAVGTAHGTPVGRAHP